MRRGESVSIIILLLIMVILCDARTGFSDDSGCYNVFDPSRRTPEGRTISSRSPFVLIIYFNNV